MKQIRKALALIMALIMSVAAFSSFAVFADGDTTAVIPTLPTVTEGEKTTKRFFFHEDFNDLTTDKVNVSSSVANIRNAGGFWLKPGSAENTYAIENSYLKHSGTEFIDLQMNNVTNYSVTENFVISAKFMPISENISGNFINFVRFTTSSQYPQLFKDLIKFKNGSISVNNTDYGKMTLNEWLLIEVAFNYNEDSKIFDSYTLMLNGKAVCEGAIDTPATLQEIKQFRMFSSMSKYIYAVDDIMLISGNQSVLYAKDFNGTTSLGNGDTTKFVPTLSTVSEASKTNRRYFFYEDFNDLAKADVNTVAKNAKNHGGFWLCNEDNGIYDIENNDYLKHSGTSYIDLQMYQLDKYSVTEDFVLSVKFMPISENISGKFIEYVRKNSDSTSGKSGAIVTFDKGDVVVNGTKCGKMYLNEWLLIEVAFNYNKDSKCFDSYTVMLNGKVVGEGTLSNSATLQEIKHFRMFRSMSSYTYATDDIMLVAGNTSSLYAKAFNGKISLGNGDPKTELVGYQTTKIVDNKFNLRLVAVMTDADYSKYQKVGFKVKATYGTTELNRTQDITTIYQSIVASEGCDYTEYTAEELGGKYIFALNCKNVPSNAGNITFEVTTYYQLVGSDVVEEKTVTFTVNPATDVAQPNVK